MDHKKFLPYRTEENLTPEEKALLTPYLSAVEGDVFVLQGLTGIIGGAFARYSRQKGGVRRSLLEFVREGQIDATKSKELMERVLIQYGDDSVGELEGAHLALENISMLATKDIEDRRIGGSPIEQSSRYLVYDHRDMHGNYRYYRDATICQGRGGEEYIAAMDFIFDTYCALQEPLKEYFQSVKPLQEAEYDILGTGERQRYGDMADERGKKDFERTYTIDLKTKVCDTLRGLLPASTLTNVGLFGNGRFYQNLLIHLYSRDLPEFRRIATEAHEHLDAVIPVYVKRARRNAYLSDRREASENMGREIEQMMTTRRGVLPVRRSFSEGGQYAPPMPASSEQVALLQRFADEKQFIAYLCADLLFPFVTVSLPELRDFLVASVAERPDLLERILTATTGKRSSRRDHLPRGFEYGYPFTFEIVADYGMYRDLQRHRMMTQQRQPLTPYLGFDMPSELVEAGLSDRVSRVYERSAQAYEILKEEHESVMAQYALCMGYNIRFVFGMNLRELSHFIELRTTPQGHPNYRRVAQKMLALLPDELKFACRFADTETHYWARGDSEAKQRVKERKLDERKG